MTPAIAAVLRVLAREGAPTVTEIVGVTGHSRGAVAKYLQRACALGYVQRLPVSRRCWRVTDAGRAACARRAA